MTTLPLVLVLLSVQLVFWVMFHAGVMRAASRDARLVGGAGQVLPPISIVVAARNEEQHVGRLLASLGEQRYPEFEIVVVDDHSTDATRALVERAAREAAGNPGEEGVAVRMDDSKEGAIAVRQAPIRLLRSEDRGKKAAIAHGVRQARHDLLAFTDADCCPGPGWLAALGRRHAVLEGHRIVVGYAPLGARKSAFGRFQRFDACLNQLFGAAAIGWGGAYMATGRNLSYDRGLFEAVGGFSRHGHVLSGDDDLFVQQVGRQAALVWMGEPASFVPSPARRGIGEWLAQKRRHSSTGAYFRGRWVALLVLFHGSHIGLWTAPLWASWWGAAALAAGLIIQMAVLGGVLARLGERDLIAYLPVLAFLNALYTLIIPITGILRPPRTWQDRDPDTVS